MFNVNQVNVQIKSIQFNSILNSIQPWTIRKKSALGLAVVWRVPVAKESRLKIERLIAPEP